MVTKLLFEVNYEFITGASHLALAKSIAELVIEDDNQFWRVSSLITTLSTCVAPVFPYQNIDP